VGGDGAAAPVGLELPLGRGAWWKAHGSNDGGGRCARITTADDEATAGGGGNVWGDGEKKEGGEVVR
jgi:hypothetical protein